MRLVFDAAPGPASSSALIDMGDRFRLVANEVEVVARRTSRCRACRSRARSGGRGRTSRPRPRPGSCAGGAAPHGAVTTRSAIEPLADFAEMAGIELLVIDERHHRPCVRRELRWNAAYHHMAGGR